MEGLTALRTRFLLPILSAIGSCICLTRSMHPKLAFSLLRLLDKSLNSGYPRFRIGRARTTMLDIIAGLGATKTGLDLIKGVRELLKRDKFDRAEILERLSNIQE